MNRTTYKNNYNKDHYDRINLVLPKGQKESLQSECRKMNLSINEYIRILIEDDLKNGSSRLYEKLSGFSDENNKILDKWQVPKKYRSMIEDFSFSDDGYFIRLKKGYINDITGSRIISVRTMQDVRRIINKSHLKSLTQDIRK